MKQFKQSVPQVQHPTGSDAAASSRMQDPDKSARIKRKFFLSLIGLAIIGSSVRAAFFYMPTHRSLPKVAGPRTKEQYIHSHGPAVVAPSDPDVQEARAEKMARYRVINAAKNQYVLEHIRGRRGTANYGAAQEQPSEEEIIKAHLPSGQKHQYANAYILSHLVHRK